MLDAGATGIAAEAVAIGIGVLLIAGAVYWGFWRRRDPLRVALQSASQDHLSNFLIPDGLGGEIYIDHLLLTDDGLLLMDVVDVEGTIFAADNLEQWTAMTPQGRMTFENPLPGLYNREAAVKLLAPDVPVTSMIMFSRRVEFPKGRPDKVATMADLETRTVDPVASPYATRWEQLKSSTRMLMAR